MTKPVRMSLAVFGLMVIASSISVLVQPDLESAKLEAPISLETMIPKNFGDWTEEPRFFTAVVNPATEALLEDTYSEVLSRTYVNGNGYRIMLSVAYARDERGGLDAHKPEICYAANGFVVGQQKTEQLATIFGPLPVERLVTSKGEREEPVTYWYKLGDMAIAGDSPQFQRRLATLRYQFDGRILDGLLFRASSIDHDLANATQMQDQFINQLLQSLSPAERSRLSGLS